MSEVRNIFDRWQRLEGEKAALSEDLKELFVEAKSNGYEPKALRLAFRRRVEADRPVSDAERETNALVDQYLAELGTPLAHARDTREAQPTQSGATAVVTEAAAPSAEKSAATPFRPDLEIPAQMRRA